MKQRDLPSIRRALTATPAPRPATGPLEIISLDPGSDSRMAPANPGASRGQCAASIRCNDHFNYAPTWLRQSRSFTPWCPGLPVDGTVVLCRPHAATIPDRASACVLPVNEGKLPSAPRSPAPAVCLPLPLAGPPRPAASECHRHKETIVEVYPATFTCSRISVPFVRASSSLTSFCFLLLLDLNEAPHLLVATYLYTLPGEPA